MNLPFSKKRANAKNFFDLKSTEKKKIIKKAVKESTEEQVKLMKKHGYAFNTYN
jgi:hypothetical protein